MPLLWNHYQNVPDWAGTPIAPIHIKYGEYEAVMGLRNLNIVDESLPKKCRQLVRECAELHQDELIEMWGAQNCHTISPLE
jgi:hypothetical protein